MKVSTGQCACGETDLLYAGTCWDCLMEATGGNWAEEALAMEEAGEFE
jgi:hypothetical protein